MTPLASNYIIGHNDVLVGRGKRCLLHEGNIRLKKIVETKLTDYLVAPTKKEKSVILLEVIAIVRRSSPLGGFVKQHPETGQYYEVGDFLAKEKVAAVFRDALSSSYASSNPSKKKRRMSMHDTSDGTEEQGSDFLKMSQWTSEDQTLRDAMQLNGSYAFCGFESAPVSPAISRIKSLMQPTHSPPTPRKVSSESDLPAIEGKFRVSTKNHLKPSETIADTFELMFENGLRDTSQAGESIAQDVEDATNLELDLLSGPLLEISEMTQSL